VGFLVIRDLFTRCLFDPFSFLQVKLAELGDVLRAELNAIASHLKAKPSVIITNRLVV